MREKALKNSQQPQLQPTASPRKVPSPKQDEKAGTPGQKIADPPVGQKNSQSTKDTVHSGPDVPKPPISLELPKPTEDTKTPAVVAGPANKHEEEEKKETEQKKEEDKKDPKKKDSDETPKFATALSFKRVKTVECFADCMEIPSEDHNPVDLPCSPTMRRGAKRVPERMVSMACFDFNRFGTSNPTRRQSLYKRGEQH